MPPDFSADGGGLLQIAYTELDVDTLVPGVVTGRLDVGGTEGAQQYNIEAFGSANSQKSFSIDGLTSDAHSHTAYRPLRHDCTFLKPEAGERSSCIHQTTSENEEEPMNMPAFTAESSLYTTSRSHSGQRSSRRGGERSARTHPAQSPAASVVPAWFTPYWCRLNEETGSFDCEEERPV